MFFLAFGSWQLSCLICVKIVQTLTRTIPVSSVLIDQMSMISSFLCVFVLVTSVHGGSLDLITFLFHFLPVFNEWSSFLVLNQRVSMLLSFWNYFCHPFEFPVETLNREGNRILWQVWILAISETWQGKKKKKSMKKKPWKKSRKIVLYTALNQSFNSRIHSDNTHLSLVHFLCILSLC